MAKNGRPPASLDEWLDLEGTFGEPEGERAERLGFLFAGGSLSVQVFPLAAAAEERHSRGRCFRRKPIVDEPSRKR